MVKKRVKARKRRRENDGVDERTSKGNETGKGEKRSRWVLFSALCHHLLLPPYLYPPDGPTHHAISHCSISDLALQHANPLSENMFPAPGEPWARNVLPWAPPFSHTYQCLGRVQPRGHVGAPQNAVVSKSHCDTFSHEYSSLYSLLVSRSKRCCRPA
jgi:hypothetical protein